MYIYCLHLQLLRWRQYVPPKYWYLPTIPLGVTTQKINVDKYASVQVNSDENATCLIASFVLSAFVTACSRHNTLSSSSIHLPVAAFSRHRAAIYRQSCELHIMIYGVLIKFCVRYAVRDMTEFLISYHQ